MFKSKALKFGANCLTFLRGQIHLQMVQNIKSYSKDDSYKYPLESLILNGLYLVYKIVPADKDSTEAKKDDSDCGPVVS